MADFRPDAVMHQFTDLPDDARRVVELSERNDAMRRDGTRNSSSPPAPSARRHGHSIAWQLSGERGNFTAEYERTVLDGGGVVMPLLPTLRTWNLLRA